ncbi:hypothetical protein [Microbacterium elymi]|uniref:hypothetical protein n=1 Tax=Microbacterium elymi TaxID=2909587 RepID=UPI00338F6C26
MDAATWAVLFFAAAPVSAIFQVGYAEALFLLWLFLALWCLRQRRYVWLYLLIPLMGYTRPGVLAFALLLGLHGIHRWRMRRREPLRIAEIVHILVLGAWAVVVGLSWTVIAGRVTGWPDAYFATELSWRRGWVDAVDAFVPFRGFWDAAGFWFDSWGLGRITGYIVLVLLVLGFAAALVFDARVRRLSPEIRLWSASYAVYLLAVFFPQSSVFRLAAAVAAVGRGRRAPVGDLAGRRAGGLHRGAVVVGLQHVRGGEYVLADPVTGRDSAVVGPTR